MRRPLVLLGVAALLALFLLFQPVRVVGPSMLPTLADGERCWTTPAWLAPPERDDLVVFREPDTEEVAVKRVAGLPGERVRLFEGDLLVDGARAARRVDRVEDLVPLVDAPAARIAEAFNVPAEAGAEQGYLHLEGRAFLRSVPLDGWLRDGVLTEGTRPASDLGLCADFELLGVDSRIELVVVEGGKTFTLGLQAGRAELREDDEVLASAVLPLDRTRGRLFLGKVDHLLHGTLDGRPLFEPVPYVSGAAPPIVGSVEGPPFEQAGFGGSRVVLQRIRVGRDLFRDPAGTYGCTRELQLGEDEYFLLGDHPGVSRDSRHYGPVRRERLLGVAQVRAGRLWLD